MKILATSSVALALLGSGVDAFACGVPFGVGMTADPQQDIIVAHKGGQETYVFQPRLCGNARSFGLILPVPAMLSQAPQLIDAKVFEHVDAMSQPKHEVRERCEGQSYRDGGGDAGGSPPRGNGPSTTVVVSGRLGFLDWAELKAESPASFTNWLDANGYPHGAEMTAAFSHYVSGAWYFVAFKIATDVDAGAGCKALGPIQLSFPAVTPVVPSRIATAGSAGLPFTWRIFGISEGTEQIDFESGALFSSEFGFSGLVGDTDVPSLGGLAQAGNRLTKWSIEMQPNANTDMVLTRHPAEDFRLTTYEYKWVVCEGGAPPADVGAPDVDADAPATPDAAATRDASAAESPDVALQDASTSPKPDVALKDASAAGNPGVITQDASTDSSTSAQPPQTHDESGDGCSVASTPVRAPSLSLFGIAGFALALIGRRRRIT
jgi:hypothetical protein